MLHYPEEYYVATEHSPKYCIYSHAYWSLNMDIVTYHSKYSNSWVIRSTRHFCLDSGIEIKFSFSENKWRIIRFDRNARMNKSIWAIFMMVWAFMFIQYLGLHGHHSNITLPGCLSLNQYLVSHVEMIGINIDLEWKRFPGNLFNQTSFFFSLYLACLVV